MKKTFLPNLFRLAILSSGVLMGYTAQAKENTPTAQNGLTLEKVVIFSRHGIRAPEEDETKDALAEVTPHKWHDWGVDVGHLTQKGAQLETYFGQYLNQYFTKHGILNAQECSSGENIHVYANSIPRTIATGEAIVKGAFPNCNVKLKHQAKIGKTDPIFSVEVRTDDEDFKKQVLNEVNLEKINNQLDPNYQLLADLIDNEESKDCLVDKDCKFFENDGKIRIEKGKRPSIKASDLRISKNIVNALLLQYYEGVPLDQIVGGEINSEEEWIKINKIKDEYFFALRGHPLVATHVAYPLISTIQKDLNSNNKITILVGHDSNIASMLAALGVKKYGLPGQYEQIPIGGKVFFEIWKDGETQQKLVKTKYVYQSAKQLRDGAKLSLANPPKEVVLKLEKCQADKNGFCAYDDFVAIFDNIARLPINAN